MGNLEQTPVDYLITQLTESGHLWITDKPDDVDELSLIIKKAKQMEKEQHQKMVDAFIKNREQTRPLIFENGFVKGFEFGLKCGEEYYDQLAKTQLSDDDFTREYLQKMSNEIYNEAIKSMSDAVI